MKSFEELNTPEELYSFIKKNIKYGYIGKNNKKKYLLNDPKFKEDWLDEYALQTPKQILENKIAVCWDYVELARLWFDNNNFKVKTIFIAFFKPKEKTYFTHTFLMFRKNGKWQIFESSFDEIKCFKEYNSIKEAINDVINIHCNYFRVNFFTKVYEYKKPKFGINSLEFCDYVMSKKIKEIQ